MENSLQYITRRLNNVKPTTISQTQCGGTFTVRMGATTQDLLGVGLLTPVWGYAADGGPVTYPGATFVAKSYVPVNVQWVNNLGFDYVLKQGADPTKDVVDDTLHWAFGKVPGSFDVDGIPAVAHLHGGHTDSDFDGLPEQWFTPTGKTGDYYVTNNYTYDNSQEAATLWYHDHALGITRQNVYAGLAGFYLLRDDNEEFLINNDMIPSGDFEIEMVIQDRMFYPDGTLAYPDAAWIAPDGSSIIPSHQPEFFGQVILVNGKAWPFLNVEPRQYRFRLLNGSDSRFYNLWITGGNLDTGPAFWVIGNDTGLLNAPVPMNQLTIGPGERYDVVVDFHGFEGQQLIVRNNARSPFPKGVTVDPKLDGRIMAFNVGLTTSGGVIAPLTPTTNLRPAADPVPVPNPAGLPVRKLMLFEAMDQYGRLQPLLGTIDPNPPAGAPADGTFLWDDPITENPTLGATEVWEIHNATVDAHPIHLHLVAFQIVNRQKYDATVVPKLNDHGTQGGALRNVRYKGQPKGPGAYEAGWKDTAIMYPGEVTRVIATFDKPGRYVWHCHILSHEDHEMMRPYYVA
jgi:spore coat protein A